MRPAAALAALLMAGACGGGGGAAPPPETAGGREPALLAVEPAAFDFGRVQPGRRLHKQFAVRNLGRGPVALEVVTDCGCMIAGDYARTLAPGGATALTLVLETPPQPGALQRTLLVRAGAPPRQVAVPVRATVVGPAGPAG